MELTYFKVQSIRCSVLKIRRASLHTRQTEQFRWLSEEVSSRENPLCIEYLGEIGMHVTAERHLLYRVALARVANL